MKHRLGFFIGLLGMTPHSPWLGIPLILLGWILVTDLVDSIQYLRPDRTPYFNY